MTKRSGREYISKHFLKQIKAKPLNDHIKMQKLDFHEYYFSIYFHSF